MKQLCSQNHVFTKTSGRLGGDPKGHSFPALFTCLWLCVLNSVPHRKSLCGIKSKTLCKEEEELRRKHWFMAGFLLAC